MCGGALAAGTRAAGTRAAGALAAGTFAAGTLAAGALAAGAHAAGPSISGGDPWGPLGRQTAVTRWRTLDESHLLSGLSSPLIKTRSSDFPPDGQTFPE